MDSGTKDPGSLTMVRDERAGGLLVLAFPLEVWQYTALAAFISLGCAAIGLARLVWLLRRARRIVDERTRFSSLFDHADTPMLIVDLDGNVDSANLAFNSAFGARVADAVGRPITAFFAADARASLFGSIRSAVSGKPRKTEASFTAGDSPMQVEISAVPIRKGERVEGVCLYVRDVTDRKQLERELQSRALHDYLTGLPNRSLFQDRLEHALNRAQRDGGSVSLLYMDLDRFKPVNDRLGHEVGDRVLTKVADRLRALVRSADTVARVGGDEFAMLLEGDCDDDEALATAKRVVGSLREEMVVDEHRILIGTSVGVARSDVDTGTPGDLVRMADLAMYEAKKRGGFQAYAYHPELEVEADGFGERVEDELRRAVRVGDLHIEYQPIIDVGGETLMGVEALVRWDHAEFGRINPSQFIPVAEESSLIAELDRWVLETSCRQIKTALAAAGGDHPLMLSVNLSARHFSEPDFIPAVSDIILRTGFDPERLQLEITETAAGGDSDRVRRLKALGVKVAIDDFGSGYSSLGYLRDLDVDVLKVDRSFVLSLGADPSSVAIVRTIITLAEILDLEVIIEGIEDAVQLGHLEDLGGRYVQGFLWGRPLPAEALPDLLRNGVRRFEAIADRSPVSLSPAGNARPYLAPVGRCHDDRNGPAPDVAGLRSNESATPARGP